MGTSMNWPEAFLCAVTIVSFCALSALMWVRR
jgi:hypothetical protein